MKISLKSTTYWVTKQISTDTKNGITSCYLIRSPWIDIRNQQQQLQKVFELTEMSNTQLDPPLGQERNKKEIKDFLEFNENECTKILKLIRHCENSAKRKVHRTKCLHKEFEEILTLVT